MGLFVYTQKGSIISTVDLPTTEIIERIEIKIIYIKGEVTPSFLILSNFVKVTI